MLARRLAQNNRSPFRASVLLGLAVLLSLPGCSGCLQVVSNNFKAEPAYSGYLGITSVSVHASAMSALLTLEPRDDSEVMRLYCRRDALPYSLVSEVPKATGTFDLQNMVPGSTYECKLNPVSYISLTEFDNPYTVSFSRPGIVATAYRNVMLVRAFGDAPTVAGGSAASQQYIGPFLPEVTIKWAPFANSEVNYQTLFAVFRVKEGGEFLVDDSVPCTTTTDISCRVNCTWGSAAETGLLKSCTDHDVGPAPARYEYVISIEHPGGVEAIPKDSTGSDSQYRTLVPVPPTNMVLVHRDSVNFEMCSLLGQTPDYLKRNRCLFGGHGRIPRDRPVVDPAAPSIPTVGALDEEIYDFGYNLFVDRWEMGCAYSPNTTWTGMIYPSPTPGVKKCASGMNCFGYFPSPGPYTEFPEYNPPNTAPVGGTFTAGMTFYNTHSRKCLVYDNNQWVNAANYLNATPDPAVIRKFTANYPQNPMPSPTGPGGTRWGKPPLTNVTRYQAETVCEAYDIPGYTSATKKKRLLRRREFSAASVMARLPGEPGALGTMDRQNLLSGQNLSSTHGCNVDFSKTGLIPSPLPSTGFPGSFNSANTSGLVANDFIAYSAPLPTALPGPTRGVVSAAGMSPAISTTPAMYRSTLLSPNRTDIFMIGSNYTSSCVSRFGAQDMFGNVSEWVSDEMCKPVAGSSCTSPHWVTSSVDSLNQDFDSTDGISTDISDYTIDGLNMCAKDSAGNCSAVVDCQRDAFGACLPGSTGDFDAGTTAGRSMASDGPTWIQPVWDSFGALVSGGVFHNWEGWNPVMGMPIFQYTFGPPTARQSHSSSDPLQSILFSDLQQGRTFPSNHRARLHIATENTTGSANSGWFPKMTPPTPAPSPVLGMAMGGSAFGIGTWEHVNFKSGTFGMRGDSTVGGSSYCQDFWRYPSQTFFTQPSASTPSNAAAACFGAKYNTNTSDPSWPVDTTIPADATFSEIPENTANFGPSAAGDYGTLMMDGESMSWDIGFRCAVSADVVQ